MGKKKSKEAEVDDQIESKKAKNVNSKAIYTESDSDEVIEFNKSKARVNYNKETQRGIRSKRGGRGSRGSRGGRGGRGGRTNLGSKDDDEHGLKIYSISSNKQHDQSLVDLSESISSEVKIQKSVTLFEDEETDKENLDKEACDNNSDPLSDTSDSSGSDIDVEMKNKIVNLKHVKQKEAKRQKEHTADLTNEKDAVKMFEISKKVSEEYAKNMDFELLRDNYDEYIKRLEGQLRNKNTELLNENREENNNLSESASSNQTTHNLQPFNTNQHPLKNNQQALNSNQQQFQNNQPPFQNIQPPFQNNHPPFQNNHPSFQNNHPPFQNNQQSFYFNQQPFYSQQPPYNPQSYNMQQPYSNHQSQQFGFPYGYSVPLTFNPQPPLQLTQQQEIKAKTQDEQNLEKKIRVASELACSDTNFAVKLMEVFFDANELTLPNLNVSGKQFNGSTDPKVGLDPERVDAIKTRVYNRLNGDEKSKRTMWNACIGAMNKKLCQLRSKAKLNE